MSEITTASPEETETLGERIGEALAAGDVIGLTGSLGAGKTRLVHGIVRGCLTAAGVDPENIGVCSPSYTVINSYERDGIRIHHLDLYRIEDVDDLESTGYWDAVDDLDAVVLVEWIRQVAEACPDYAVELTLEVVDRSDPHHSPRRLRLTAGESTETGTRIRAALKSSD